MNRIVGHKVSIVSNKPQTTRKRVIGIATTENYQVAFVDTPGIHEPHNRLGRAMVDQARRSLSEVDVVVYVADGAHHPGELDREIAHQIKASVAEHPMPVVLCMNRMDQLKAEDVERNLAAYTELVGSNDFMMTSATRGFNVDKLVALIVQKLPERAPMYDADEFTDQSSRFMAAELIREKIIIATRQEIPHSIAVLVEDWEQEDKLIHIGATILVEKSSQRGILIGKQGQFLKQIGSEARAEIEEVLGQNVFLELHVKVSEGWRQNLSTLHDLEYSE